MKGCECGVDGEGTVFFSKCSLHRQLSKTTFKKLQILEVEGIAHCGGQAPTRAGRRLTYRPVDVPPLDTGKGTRARFVALHQCSTRPASAAAAIDPAGPCPTDHRLPFQIISGLLNVQPPHTPLVKLLAKAASH